MDARKSTRRTPLVATAAVVAALMLAALLPAAAAANTTSLTLVANPETIVFDGTSVLTGTLMDTTTMTALGGLPVVVESSPTGGDPYAASWETIAVITTLGSAPEYYTGTYTFVVAPRDKTYYRMRFPGTAQLDPATSAAVAVTPGVWLSRPTTKARVLAGQRFRVTCFIQPRHPAGLRNVVKFQFFRYVKPNWVLKRTKWATTANYLNFTKLTLKTSIKTPGKWRVRAYAPADARHAATYSVFSKTFRVVR